MQVVHASTTGRFGGVIISGCGPTYRISSDRLRAVYLFPGTYIGSEGAPCLFELGSTHCWVCYYLEHAH